MSLLDEKFSVTDRCETESKSMARAVAGVLPASGGTALTSAWVGAIGMTAGNDRSSRRCTPRWALFFLRSPEDRLVKRVANMAVSPVLGVWYGEPVVGSSIHPLVRRV